MVVFDEAIDRKKSNSIKWNSNTLLSLYKNEDVIPLWVADMDFKAPQAVIDQFIERVKHGVFGYDSRPDKYYEAVIAWMKRRHSWEIKREWISYSPGIVPAINLLIQTFCRPGEKVLLQSPVYYPFFSAVLNNGCTVVDNTLKFNGSKFSIDFEDFENKAKDPRVKMFLLCSPHNPISRVWSAEELKRMGEICNKHDVLVVADEIHNDIVYKNSKHTVYATISNEFSDNAIILTAPSKTFNLAGLYSSNVIISNAKLKERFDQTVENHGLTMQNTFGIVAVQAAYTYGEEWLEDAIEYLWGNVDVLERYIQTNIKKAKLILPEATYLALIDISEYRIEDPEQFFAVNAKVGVYDGIRFGEAGKGFIRICFACPRDVLIECLNHIADALEIQSDTAQRERRKL